MSSNWHLLSVGSNVFLHNEYDPEPLLYFNNHVGQINAAKFNVYGTVLASGADDGLINFQGLKDQNVPIYYKSGPNKGNQF